MNIIIDYNRTLFDPATGSLYPGVYGLLKRISRSHRLFLVSRKVPYREEAFSSFGIQQFFKDIFFVEDKTTEVFVHCGKEADLVIVIGDSVQDEIRIGNILGYITVRVKQGKFMNDIPVSQAESPTYEVSTINELENIIQMYEK